MIRPQFLRVDRRLLVAGAGLAGVVLGLLLLVTVFGGGGDGGDTGSGPSPPPASPVPVSAAEAKVPAPPAAAVEAASVVATRDPFRQLATAPNAPVSGPTPSAAPSVQAGATGPPGETKATASLELKSITKDGAGTARAAITVDGQPYNPAQGEVFAYGYRLERIDGNCVEVSAQGARANMCVPVARP